MSKETKIRRALVSVFNKTGVVEFAKALHEEFGVEILSTGGTARSLADAGVPVTMVEDVTGFPEMMDGRVKTLHPKVHAGILANRDNPDHMKQLQAQGIEPIDMVVVNLYPFDETIAKPDCTFAQAIEMIDIGGPCMLRATAKNHQHVVPVPDPELYDEILEMLREHGDIPQAGRLKLAEWTFAKTMVYDDQIACFLSEQLDAQHDEDEDPVAEDTLPMVADLDAVQKSVLRYGENPHQQAGVYERMADDAECSGGGDLVSADVIQGEMSFNNYADASAAFELCAELSREAPADRSRVCCFIKHTNACGAALDAESVEAYRKAYLGDANAAMGGILAVNFRVDKEFAESVMNTYATWGKPAGAMGFFVEVWIAPGFDADAIELIRSAKAWGERVRLVAIDNFDRPSCEGELDFKRISGGVLVQNRDLLGLNESDWMVKTERQPTDTEMNDLRLAWLVCKHTKSNAITICKDGMLVGNGPGQVSRIMSARIATWTAEENGHGDQLKGAVAASDAFFPFSDGPNQLADAGVTAIIQPGGAKRDEDVVSAANERGLAMILTGTRHFKH